MAQVDGSGTAPAENVPLTLAEVEASVQPNKLLQSIVTGVVNAVLASAMPRGTPSKLAGMVSDNIVRPLNGGSLAANASANPPRGPVRTSSQVPSRQTVPHSGASTE